MCGTWTISILLLSLLAHPTQQCPPQTLTYSLGRAKTHAKASSSIHGAFNIVLRFVDKNPTRAYFYLTRIIVLDGRKRVRPKCYDPLENHPGQQGRPRREARMVSERGAWPSYHGQGIYLFIWLLVEFLSTSPRFIEHAAHGRSCQA